VSDHDPLRAAKLERAAVMEAIRQGDPADAVGHLSDVVGDLLREHERLRCEVESLRAALRDTNRRAVRADRRTAVIG
jgi:hypothetical protein